MLVSGRVNQMIHNRKHPVWILETCKGKWWLLSVEPLVSPWSIHFVDIWSRFQKLTAGFQPSTVWQHQTRRFDPVKLSWVKVVRFLSLTYSSFHSSGSRKQVPLKQVSFTASCSTSMFLGKRANGTTSRYHVTVFQIHGALPYFLRPLSRNKAHFKLWCQS